MPVIKRLIVPVLCAGVAWGSLLGGRAEGATLSGVTFPDTYPVQGQTLALNGLGLRTLTVLNIRAYVAGLYLAQRSANAQQIMGSAAPKVLLMQFLHAGTKAQIERQFHNGEMVNCGSGGCDPANQADFDKLVSAAPAVAVGDTFTFIVTQRGVGFYANNRLLVQSNSPDLGRLILQGFIGSHPPSEDLRKSLLGG